MAHGSSGNDTATAVPILVTYAAVDDSGNNAKPVRRRVYVLCKAPEFACPADDASSLPMCSANRICGVQLDSGAANTSVNLDAQLIPRFSLNGPSTMVVRQGTPYVPCRGSVTTSCEPGVTATLKRTGDLANEASSVGLPAGSVCVAWRTACKCCALPEPVGARVHTKHQQPTAVRPSGASVLWHRHPRARQLLHHLPPHVAEH